jgi:hypothetical protein
MEFDVYAIFPAIVAWLILAYALSATGRRLRRGFGGRSVAWLDSLQRRAVAIAKSMYVVQVCIAAVFVWLVQWPMTKRMPLLFLLILITGVCVAVGNMFRELSGYAKSEIQARVPSRHGEAMMAPRFAMRDLVGPIQIAIFLVLVFAVPAGPHRHEIIMAYLLLSLTVVWLLRGSIR